MTTDFEAMAAELEASGDYRVLRRLTPRIGPRGDDAGSRLGIVIDTETTGLDPAVHEIIELAMVPIRYDADGRIVNVGTAFNALRQPREPIPPEITALTGITDADVAGKAIDAEAVEQFVSGAVLVIAHNAAFDRPFAEKHFEVFAKKPWACSMSEVDWKGEGMAGQGLDNLLTGAGLFCDRHRGVVDCYAVVELLERPLPRSGRTGLAALLEAARRATWRVWATDAPFALKETLKTRGYRWSPGDAAWPKAWFVDVADPEAELKWLSAEIYHRPTGALRVDRLTAFERFTR